MRSVHVFVLEDRSIRSRPFSSFTREAVRRPRRMLFVGVVSAAARRALTRVLGRHGKGTSGLGSIPFDTARPGDPVGRTSKPGSGRVTRFRDVVAVVRR